MEKKKHPVGIALLTLILLLTGCKRDWEDHYQVQSINSKVNLWAAIQQEKDLSAFVQYMKQFEFDTLFISNNTYTLFAPTNTAFSQFTGNDSVTRTLVKYLIANTFIQSGNIHGTRKVQTLSKKFALFVNNETGMFLDYSPLSYESPLFLNGKFFKLSSVAKPRPNIYEYIAATNPVLRKYIDSKDSIILDKTLSKPIGFDAKGNTIYDTVSVIYNTFEAKFFPIKHEFRNQTATLVFPKDSDYKNALTQLALSLQLPSYHDYHDIPLTWQNEVLIPYLLVHGIFKNMIEESEFQKKTPKDTVKLKNILGDSIIIDYLPSEKTICSNGYAYNYSNFKIPDTLYASPYRFEAEWLLKDIGINRYAYKEIAEVTSSTTFPPLKEYISTASNDTIMKVNFTNGYKGTYTLKFNIKTLFPRKYLMVVRTNINLGGIYNIYVNGVLVKKFDYSYYVASSGNYTSVTGKKYGAQAGFNIFDCWVTNLTDYGIAEITFDYQGPGTVRANGLSIDYIGFIPY